MELNTIEISPQEAAAKLAEYEKAVREERNAEDEAILAGYRAAARGLPVISLPRTIAAGGFHPGGLPKMAVVRADAVECSVQWAGSWSGPADLVFTDQDGQRNLGALVGAHSVRVTVPGDAMPPRLARTASRGTALVPLIPPGIRPKPRRLRHCHILWEVGEWTLTAPYDPALIRHIRGDLWMVLAAWDLTELERLVLSQR